MKRRKLSFLSSNADNNKFSVNEVMFKNFIYATTK